MSGQLRVCFIIALLATVATLHPRIGVAEVNAPLRHGARTPMLVESSTDNRVSNEPRQRRLVRLPPVTAVRQAEAITAVGRGTPADGTFRDEGQFLVININGQEYRLQRSDQSPVSAEPQEETRSGGSVRGRLSHGGRPLAGCEVALIRLNKTWTGYRVIPSDKLVTTVTDSDGVYRFTAVEQGPYKLKWRPAGENEWIRRVEVRPDVQVRNNESSKVKEVRVALRTIN